jgi:hypothetical protein
MNDAGARLQPPAAAALALEALGLCRAGKTKEGIALYRQALRAPGSADLPVCRHVDLLKGTGLDDAASRVLRAAIRANLDLSPRSSNPLEAAADYESLFQRSIGNVRMMENYLIALSRIGAAARLREATDPDILFRQAPLDIEGSLEPFLAGVAAALLNDRNRQFQESSRSLRKMGRVLETHKSDDAGIIALHAAVRRQITAYVRDVSSSGHLIARWLPGEILLESWGVIYEESGYSAPHTHPGCWVVAVAYIAGEDPAGSGEDDAGTMRIGPAAAGDASCPGWPDLTVAPIPGTVVIMPAYYTHWIVPLRRPGIRISVAFNAADVSRYMLPDFCRGGL